MTITSTVAIDLVDRDRYPLAQVYAKQDDSLSRAIAASIYAAGVAWVPPSGATAVIRYRRPDGIGGIYDELPDGSVAYTIADNVITAYIAPDALSCPGRVRMDIVIVNGTEALATFDISVLVDAAPTSGVAPTNGYYKYKTLADINAALAARVQSVNNQAPDNKGNVQINAEQTGAVSQTAFDAAMTTVVRKVNGVTPDDDGNVNVSGGSGGNVLSVNGNTGAVQIPTPASGVCSIGADIPAKVVESVSPGASPTHGALVYVKFEAANTAGNPTLTFMGYTAPIVDGGGNAVAPGALTAGTHGFQRRGETWVLLDALCIDTSLTISGKAADAKATGDALRSLSEEIANLPSSGGSGLSSSERSTLIAVVNAIGAFNVTNGQELIDAFNDAWVQKIPATGITLSAASLSFTAGTSQALTATVEPSDSTDTVVWSSSNTAVATVSNGVVTPVSNGDCIITARAGSVSASCAVNVAFAEEVVYYTITNNLTNCTSDNSAASVVEGGSYTANLTAADGYTLDGASVSVVVNGEDVTDTAYSGGVITIQSVTGDMVITAIAVYVGATEEVTLLKSITGDGASYIDTGITMADLGADVQIELSAKLASNDDDPTLFGADMWNLYSSYGRVDATKSTLYCHLNNGTGKNYPTSQDSNGFWNSTAVPNLYAEQRWYKYVVSPDGTLAAVYMDEEMTKIPSSANATMTAFTNYDADVIASSLPIIPIHIFASNVSDSANNAGKGYDTPGTFTLYYFRIKKYSTGDVLHEYLPAKQGAEIGMYDAVTNTFLPNAGTGTFSYEEVA